MRRNISAALLRVIASMACNCARRALSWSSNSFANLLTRLVLNYLECVVRKPKQIEMESGPIG